MGKKQSFKRPMKAFTLIELLVVVAIIAVLISILLPAIQTARESARGIDCVSRLHEVGKATHMYVQDNEGLLPGYGKYTSSGYMWAHWKYRHCLVPADPETGEDYPLYGITRAIQGHCPSRPYIVACYEGINYWYNRQSCNDRLKMDKVEEPSNSSFIMDGKPYDPHPQMNWITTPEGLGYEHNNRASILFVDGHAGLFNHWEVTQSMLYFTIYR